MKTTNTRTNTTAQTNKQTFIDLLRAYEKQAIVRTPQTEKDYTTALLNLATATAQSVLKKCIDTSGNKTLKTLKAEIVRDTKNLEKLTFANANAYETTFNKDGKRERVVKDKDLHEFIQDFCNMSFGDGYDLVQIAILAIIEQTAQAKDRNEGKLKKHFLEKSFTVRKLNRKVWIKAEDSVKGWETVETTPIQEIYKTIRREIENSRLLESSKVYTYISEMATDEESEEQEIIYRRLPKYFDLGGMVTDFNGKETVYTADTQTVQDIDTLVASLNLSKQQANILQLRLSGYGYKAIATYFGIDVRNVLNQVKRIQAKATAIGLQPCTK